MGQVSLLRRFYRPIPANLIYASRELKKIIKADKDRWPAASRTPSHFTQASETPGAGPSSGAPPAPTAFAAAGNPFAAFINHA